jgi:hypothetical protein
MKPIRTDKITINAGMTAKGEPRPTTYPVDVYDPSGLDNDHMFSGVIPGVAQGNQPQAQPTTPPDALEYAQANHKPQGMDAQPNAPGEAV